MSAATLAERLRRLAAVQSGAAPVLPPAARQAAGDDALAELMRRVARLRASAPRRAAPSDDAALAARWGGRVAAAGLVAVERRYPLWHRQGAVALARLARLGGDAHGCLRWAQAIDPARLLFIDTETSGLAGGSGSLAFMLGLGRLDGASFVVTQFVLSRFAGEAALFDALAPRVAAGTTLVSYNGKSFDLPLIAARARLAGRRDGLAGLPHIDLLHALRRRHGRDLPDCRLASAEARLLRFARRDDLPGAEAPQAWRRLLRGDAAGMAGVLRHNRDDIVSMAALLPQLAGAGSVPCQA